MAQHVIYECDWCGRKEPAPQEDAWPEGWSSIDADPELHVPDHDVLCKDCIVHLNNAILSASMDRKEMRGKEKS